MSNYKILSIDPVKGHVTFELEDGIEQRVCDFPTDDAEKLKEKIEQYASEYVSPIKAVKTLKPEVSALIGVKIDFVKAQDKVEAVAEEAIESVK